MNPDAVGTTVEGDFAYEWPLAVSYALAIGAKKDELDFLYQARGPKVIPTFALVAGYRPVIECFGPLEGVFPMEVHGGQSLRVHRPIPPEGTIHTVARVERIYDKKSFALVILSAKHTVGGDLVAEAVWSTIWRADGGFGGPPPPPRDVVEPPDREADWTFADPSSPEQAIHYSTFGDYNPSHIDPDWAKQAGFEKGPILQGLCTMGFVTRAAIHRACGGDVDRLKYIDVEFRKNVWPGETLTTKGWDVGDGVVALRTWAADRADPVVTRAWVEIA